MMGRKWTRKGANTLPGISEEGEISSWKSIMDKVASEICFKCADFHM